MKIIYKTNIILLLFFIMGISACEDYLDVNDNPNEPTEAPIAGLMVNSTFETSQNVFRLGEITTNFVQQIASPNPGASSDIFDDVSHSNTWFNLFNVMTDLNVLITQAEEAQAYQHMGVAQILLALNLGMTLDAWGDIPYSQAFEFETVNPAYDDDQDLYTEVQRLLDAGLSNISKESLVVLAEDDFIYGGDLEKWQKLAYMLKARYLNHLSKQPSYDATVVLAALDQGFESNADDAQMSYFEEEFNPWANIAIDNADLLLGGWISEQFIEALDGSTFGVFDPRLPLMVGTTDDGDYVGTENGAGRGDAPEAGARSTLVTGDFYSSPQSPMLIATYAEQKFIEAEAALRGGNQERAYDAYLAGIRAHMEKLGVEEADIVAYLSEPVVGMGEASLTLDAIFKEKYVAMFLHPEAWVDARRYNYAYEDMTLPAKAVLGDEFIRRLSYPTTETSRNGSQVPNVSLTDRLWWDQ